MRLPLPSSHGKGAASRFDASKLVNMYARPASRGGASKDRFYLESTPGLKIFADLSAFPIRALVRLGDNVYAVSGKTLYKISETGNFEAIEGEIDGNDRLTVAKLRKQLGFCEQGSIYAYDEDDGLGVVTDSSVYPASSITAQNHRIIYDRDDEEGDQYRWSDLNSARNYNALNFATAERNDDALTRVFARNDDLFLFGTESMEIVRPQAFANVVYALIPGAATDHGISGKHAVAKSGNTVYFHSDDGSVYKVAGYSPVLIGSTAISDAFFGCSSHKNVEACSYRQMNGDFIGFTSANDNLTMVYDAVTDSWHQRSSYFENSNRAWRCRMMVKAFGKVLAGDLYSGKIYEVCPDHYDEAGEEIRREVWFGSQYMEAKGSNVSTLEVIMDTGHGGHLTDTDTDPIVTLEVSRDGGRTFDTVQRQSAGLEGKYSRRLVYTNLGHSPLDYTFKLSMSAKCPWRIAAVDVR